MKRNLIGTHPFPVLTERKVLRKARIRTGGSLIKTLFVLFFTVLLLAGMVRDAFDGFSRLNLLILLLLAPAGFLAVYVPLKKGQAAIASLEAISSSEMISPHGSAEEITDALRDPENVMLPDHSSVILTRSYLMLRNNFSTYLPLHAIHKIPVYPYHTPRNSGIQIKAVDSRGRTCIFDMEPPSDPTALTEYQNQTAQILRETLAEYAPEVAFSC